MEAFYHDEAFTIKGYHLDNGAFASRDFKKDCDEQKHLYLFSGIDVQYQNGIAKQHIKKIACWARASMLYDALHWPTYAKVKVWPMAINYKVCVQPFASVGHGCLSKQSLVIIVLCPQRFLVCS